ncbi:MAG: hypothetical protein P1V34_18365 [Alphaproteobacteria bacterium]|nr:hypothetical protein [Alphaproteobacteria bacterium]
MNKSEEISSQQSQTRVSGRSPSQDMAVPPKFLDAATGEVNVGALLRSYQELERKLGQGQGAAQTPSPELDQAAMLKALGVPDTPEQYRIDILEDYLERDMEMEAVLHQAGFTEAQVQLVYDLAAEKLAPLIVEVVQAARGAGDSARLEAHFGGPERWKEIRRQMRKWGQKNLPGDAFNSLCSSFDGIMAVHRMMAAGDEPGLTKGGDRGEPLSEDQLKRVMNDPRYWRDHDPALTRKVQNGFKQLYPDGA